MKKKSSAILCIGLIFTLIFCLGCQSNGVKETIQRDLDDLQKQIFELQQDQAYLNTKVEQTTTQISYLNEQMAKKGSQLEVIIHNQEEFQKDLKEIKEIKTTPPASISEQAIKPEIQEISKPVNKPAEALVKLSISPSKLYNSALDHIHSGQLDDAIPILQQYLETYPRTELADNAQYWLGECYYKKGNFQKAINEFKKVISDYPHGNKLPASILKLGYSYYELRQMPQALESLQKIINQYPNDAVYSLAQKKIDIILSER